MLIFEGASLYDGEPIIVLAHPDHNKKTGTMLATWIILRDVEPEQAAFDGRDVSICGHCPYRADLTTGDRACYVRTNREPALLYDKYKDNEYKLVSPDTDWHKLVNPYRLPVRVGSYGDPAMVPLWVWEKLVATASRYTGYTHLHDWDGVDPDLKKYCMASVDTLEQRDRAQAAGWRTFLVVPDVDDVWKMDAAKQTGDILCPASDLGGRKTTCDKCRLCQGTSIGCEKSIFIPAHGPGKEFV